MTVRLSRIAAAFGAALTASLLAAPAAFAASNGTEPARGAPIRDVIVGTLVGGALTALVIWVAYRYREGGMRWLDRLAERSSKVSGLPGWAALPSAVTGVSLLVAVFGFYWDVAKHIDTGRDPSPFGTAAHYPILAGLFGIALGGALAIVLGVRGRVPTSVRIAGDWRAPLGGVLIFLCGSFALAGFPLDDVWHTLFGQDVTLWGPTHVLMIAGASLATLGVWVLLVEARRSQIAEHGAPRREAWHHRLRYVSIAGGFMLGLSTLQGEFDYGVPQFQLLYQPVMIMFAAGVGLVAARVYMGRGGALKAVAFFLVVRALLTLVVGPVLGESTLHFPLYIVEALIVEAVALRLGRERSVTTGVAAGVGIGTLGLAAEWGWSHVWMPLPWPSSLLPEAVILGLLAAVAGGVIGGYIGRALTSEEIVPQHAPRWALPAAALVALFCLAWPMSMNAGDPAKATVTLNDVNGPPNRTVNATVRLEPRDAAKDSQWLTLTSWQGGGLHVDRLKKVGEGVYRSTEPVPVYGNWKTMLRLENGRGVRSVPVYLPEDKAIPAKLVPATHQFTRAFVRDKKVLQREASGGGWLWLPAYLVLLGIAALWLGGLGWGLTRLERSVGAQVPEARGGRPPSTGRFERRGGAVTPA
ncbi:MAG: hypothetical protein ACJ76V_09950 [Thermoleophilaceae bacterium]